MDVDIVVIIMIIVVDDMIIHSSSIEAGDLILWDSRTIHGGFVGNGKNVKAETGLARLAMTVCMTPNSFATDEIRELRMKAFEKGLTTTHWPHEYHIHGNYGEIRSATPYVPITLTQTQRNLMQGKYHHQYIVPYSKHLEFFVS